MTDPQPPDVDLAFLGPLGIPATAEALYRRIIDHGALRTPDDDAAVRALLEAGLIERHGDDLTAVPARVAIERWAIDREAEIRRARVAADHFASIQHTIADSFLELIRGRQSVREQFRHLETIATTQLRVFDCEPYLSDSRGTISPAQESVSSQGVRYRVLYQSKVLEDPAIMAQVRLALSFGEDARAYHAVPVRMVISDDTRALLILPYGSAPDTGNPIDVDAVLVHRSTMLDALIRLFESMWALGVPVRANDSESTDDLRQLVDLLVTGLTDASIARELQVSERTVHRRITRLHELLGTTTRFQLGVQAVKQGWI